MADRVDRRRFAPATALWQDMVPFGPAPERTPAKEASGAHRRSQWRPMNHPNTAIPTTTQKMTTPQNDQGLCA